MVRLVMLALEQSDRPMRASEIYKAACEIAGEQLLWSTVKRGRRTLSLQKVPISGSCVGYLRDP
jgi:hypothetical protein